ncbi:ABC transporter ATP-binding protein [Limobrevibacterium gyesilva]|uniref:ABC transporter ATP-binding protein n=1 Tax=Limobrevibacterium gyesilva TaxID=2991712 RepID=A0AA41YNJ8_9PROT|nr:ABC transporter ATP-binding protein [Limobrevibacterium gyesilva]MCW3476814.1 ABC transporter ATP-binding protein [Limobrevibacterium gyesilva]
MLEAPLLAVRALTAGYGPFQVLHGIDLDVAAGEIVAVLGANGVGKTTLNRTLSGVTRARAGSIRFDGQDITRAGHDAIVAAGLIQVPEGRKIFPNLSVRDNLLLGAWLRGRPERTRSLERVLAIFPRLRERLSQSAGSMSGGEQQMLAIGRGLMAQPRLLILDEPSLGLSPLLTEELFALITSLHAEGLSILLVEQNVVQSLAVAGRAYVIEHGRVALSGAAADLADDPRLKAAYLGI